ncbi:hypothetical protein GNI_005190 [Gregarina niphandrodes]|uniref:C2 domain-containing protein n=1 Tax=Gregarina niphandrodes TaxID=110365 RepID=A0A023BDL6_GRENI|nr:hypothetical protein GNI_005190 [Gregarina niphandrodes]EZG88171.1 hypothetical protein GNI_005190 [Gregarina niphandrodes]|eukprot:XP_011128595.1 hypothetical protein GNI_005190 [Gregarina niphandrodes]
MTLALVIDQVVNCHALPDKYFVRVKIGDHKFETHYGKRSKDVISYQVNSVFESYEAPDIEVYLIGVDGEVVAQRTVKAWRKYLHNGKGSLTVGFARPKVRGVHAGGADSSDGGNDEFGAQVKLRLYLDSDMSFLAYDRFDVYVSKLQDMDETRSGRPKMVLSLGEVDLTLDKPSEGADEGEWLWEETFPFLYHRERVLNVNVFCENGAAYGKAAIDIHQLMHVMTKEAAHEKQQDLVSAGWLPVTDAEGVTVARLLVGAEVWDTTKTISHMSHHPVNVLQKLEERAAFDEMLLRKLQDEHALGESDAVNVERDLANARNVLEEIRVINSSLQDGQIVSRQALKRGRREEIRKIDDAENQLAAAETKLYNASCDAAKKNLKVVQAANKEGQDLVRRCQLQMMTSPRKTDSLQDQFVIKREQKINALQEELYTCLQTTTTHRDNVYGANLMTDIPPNLEAIDIKRHQAHRILGDLQNFSDTINAEDEELRRQLRYKQLEEDNLLLEAKPVLIERPNMGCFTCCMGN